MLISIHPLAETDFVAAAKVLTSAFQRNGDWISDLRLYCRLQPDGYFGAYQDGILAGMVGATIYSAYAYIGLMGVHQEFQRRGIGLALMQHLLTWLENKEVTQVALDASPVGQPLYEKLGFVACDRAYVFQRQNGKPVFNCPIETRNLSHQDLNSVTLADTRAFGANRSRLLQALLETYPGRAFIMQNEQGQINGYLFAQNRRIGPWIMQGTEGAEILLRAALSLPYSDSVSIVVPASNINAIDLLQDYDFEIIRINCHMVRGLDKSASQRDKVFGQTSLSLG